jgi:hypothetical protein
MAQAKGRMAQESSEGQVARDEGSMAGGAQAVMASQARKGKKTNTTTPEIHFQRP